MISLIPFVANAQAPGYLGKHFLINYEFYTMPALSNPNINGKSGITSLNTRHAVSVDWVTGLRQSVGLSFHYTKSQFKFDKNLQYNLKYLDYSGEAHETMETMNYGDTKGDLTAYAIGLHTNLYFNQYIAPLGTYFKPEILLVIMNVSYDSSQANQNLRANTLNQYGNPSGPVLSNDSPYLTAAIGATIGTHYIFFNRVVFDIGFQFGIMYAENLIGHLMKDGPELVQGKINEKNFLKVAAQNRLTGQYFLNVKAGLGILIF